MVALLFTSITHPCLNPIPTGLGHVTLIYGLIPPMAGRNRVKWHVDLRPQAIKTVVEMLAELLKSASNYKTGQNIDLTFGRNSSIRIKVC